MFGVCVCFPVLTQPVVSCWLISQPERDWTHPGEGRGGGTEPINRCLPAQVCWYHLSLSLSLSPQQSQHDNNLTYNRSQSPLPPRLAWPGSRQASPSQAGQILLFLFSPAWPAVTANTVLVYSNSPNSSITNTSVWYFTPSLSPAFLRPITNIPS